MTTRARRRLRIHVAGFLDMDTDDTPPEAVEFARQQMQKIFDQFGFQLWQSGLEFKQPLEP